MYKAVRLFNYKDGIGLEQDALRGVCEVEEHVCTTEDEIISACQDADAVMGIFEPLTARVIHSLPKLKLIACKSMGYNYVDLEAAKECGVSVTHLKSAFSIDVADYVTACILAHNKRLFAYDRSVRADKKWDYSVCPDIHRLRDETVGLAGFGQIARLVAKNLSGFGVRILAADPFIDQSIGDAYGVTMVDMKTLFRESDYISLHVPLIEGTEHLIGKELFDEIPDHLVFINSARGGVVVEQEMIDAIDSGQESPGRISTCSRTSTLTWTPTHWPVATMSSSLRTSRSTRRSPPATAACSAAPTSVTTSPGTTTGASSVPGAYNHKN